jgi:hypothetical protein
VRRYSQVRVEIFVAVIKMFSHSPADVIFKLVTTPGVDGKLFVGRESGVGSMFAALCIQRCNFAVRQPRFDAKFVDERQRVCGTADKDWIAKSGSLHWLSSKGDSPFNQEWPEDATTDYSYNFNAFSGVLPLFQPVEPAQLKPKQDQETADTKTRFFSWYPEQDHMSEDVVRSFEHHISPEDCKGNLDWNARVVVMDLLLLLAEKEDVDDAVRLLRKLFPGTKALDNSKYPEYSGPKTKLNGLLLFFSYFWVPAIEFFRDVLEKGDVGDKRNADVAIGEVCHVLGITCRTQWMLQGFFCQSDAAKLGKIEYLPCRFDRLLSLLCRDPGNSDSKAALQRFLNDISEIYKLLRNRYLEKNETKIKDNETNITEEFAVWSEEIPLKWKETFTATGYGGTFFPATKHFLLRNSSFKCKEGMCADPRTMDNVYFFSLLDFS